MRESGWTSIASAPSEMEEGALWLAVQASAGSNNTWVKTGWILSCIRIVTYE